MAGTEEPVLLIALLLVVTFTTGVMDAISVLGLGRVFTANMTGNVVFLGFAAAGTAGFTPWVYIASLAAFLVGAAIGGRLGRSFDASRNQWLLCVGLIESGILFVAAVLARGYQWEPFVATGRAYLLIALAAIAMGMRNATVRRLGVADMTTTVLTLTLTGLGADSRLAGGTNVRWPRRIASVTAIFAGAAIGALLVEWLGVAWPLALTGALSLLATLTYLATRQPL
jgi:uncharacterized membrane protein YoaK (UPF0700 family)